MRRRQVQPMKSVLVGAPLSRSHSCRWHKQDVRMQDSRRGKLRGEGEGPHTVPQEKRKREPARSTQRVVSVIPAEVGIFL